MAQLSNHFAPGHYRMLWNITITGFNAYTATSAFDLGLVEGVRLLNRTPNAQMLQADLYGKSDIEGVYQGGQMALAMTLKEWKLANREVIWPYSLVADGGDFGQADLSGRLLTDICRSFALLAQPLTPANALNAAGGGGGLQTILVGQAVLAPDTEVGILLGNEQRDIPVVFKILPYNDGTSVRWFSYGDITLTS
jgi:hypothetical protein